MKSRPFIILMGLRASGKTTVARLLSARLGYAAVDLDDLVAARMGEAHAGACIRAHGFAAFRQAEADTLNETLAANAHTPGNKGLVLALGGGTPTAPGAADMLREARQSEQALIIYLRASEHTLRSRLAGDAHTDRPSITGAGTLDEVGKMFRERDPLYRELAERVIECDGLRATEITERIAAWC